MRIFVEENFTEGNSITLSSHKYADEIKHLYKVMRLQVGDKLFLSNGKGVEAQAQIEKIDRENVQLKILSCKEKAESNLAKIILLQSVLKGPKMDWLVEKITELGVRELYPISTEHTVALGEDSSSKHSRWERITRAALKQSGALFLPHIHPTTELQQAVEIIDKNNESSTKIVLHPDVNAKGLLRTLEKIPQDQNTLILCIGPEGGLSDEEIKYLKAKGFLTAGLGEQILRGETASIVASAISIHYFSSRA